MDAAGEAGRRIFRVGELTRWIKSVLEEKVGTVWVEGEVSNLRRPASGHLYFTIKDESAQLAAVMFRGDQRALRLALKDGVLVRVFGSVTVYERGGNYQIIVRQVEAAGQGALQARFEALKAKLQQEGLFEASRKKRLPLLPRHIGIVTSPTGAAIRDILNVINRRFPNVHIVLVPVRVQGEGAADEIAAGIDLLNARGGTDVMIVGRGGGSLEDLWCFNEEVVARAIARSAIPVISAVGHETDFTISDFVADLRAPTPSAAAELVVSRKEEFAERIGVLNQRLRQSLGQWALRARNRLIRLGANPVFREPRRVVDVYRHRLEQAGLRIRHGLHGRLMDAQQAVDEAGTSMAHRVEMRRQADAEKVRRLTGQLEALNPLAVLRRGYSVVTDPAGRVLRSARDTAVGRAIVARLSDGAIDASVTGVRSGGGKTSSGGG